MKLGIIRLYAGESGKAGYYNIQEIGLAKALAKKGILIDIFFLISKKKNKSAIVKEINENIRVIYIPSNKLFNHGIVSPKFILDYQIDIIHLLSDNQLMVPNFIKFCNKYNIPVYNYIGTIHSDTKSKFKRVFMDVLAKRNIKYYKVSDTVVKTPDIREQLRNYGVNKVELIPVGLDFDIIPQITENKAKLKKELNIELNKKILMFVGRLEEYKEPLKAVELINALVEEDKEYMLIMIGQGSLKNKIDNLIQKYKLNNNIIQIEKVQNSDIHKYYKASDIFLNFNSKEIFGMSILEAMYQGCKVIAKDAPGPNYIINNNVDGIIINNYDIDTWINAIKKSVDNDEMSKLAKQKIENNFNWESIAQTYTKLFEK